MRITNSVAATHLSLFTYEYDALDQITRWGQIRGVNPAREMRAAYDEMNRLVAAPVWRDNGVGNWTPETDLDNNILTEIMDNSVGVRASYDYDPWGRVMKTSGDRDADFLFQGMYQHGSSELQLPKLGRPYSPLLGRWLRRDAIGERGGINIYGALANNPLNYIDPKGDNPLVIAAVVATLLLVEPDNADAPTPDSPKPQPPDLRIKLATAALVLGFLGPLFHESFGDGEPCPVTPPLDPTQPPGEEWEWRGKGEPGSTEGSWYKPATGESLHPDLSHPDPIGPHWDYNRPGGGDGWRVPPGGGTMTPK